ncbi:MAG: TetR/AcrR family transcriptional regulator [Deltaproteobacteria bacterium]|nr:TetR/AcrR family transcriptional regulator [Deltaproteobacteria bacterium]
MAEQDKKTRILNAAMKIFACKGYQYTTIAEIAKEAGVSKGLVHVCFENKLDILLDVILFFIDTVNDLINQKLARCTNPVEKLHAVFAALMELMSQSSRNLYWGHILKEVLPDTEKIKDENLKKKYALIIGGARQLQLTLDELIADGQRQGLIESSLKPQIIRQIIGGSSQMLYQGLILESHGRRVMGYTEEDVRDGIVTLIDKFVIK